MNKELIIKNKQIRKSRPILNPKVLYSTYENNGVFQICFKSRGCSNYLNGFCIMCDYGVSNNITPNELDSAFDQAMNESKEKIRTLLLNSFGSVLDQAEISRECFITLLKKIKNTNIKNIIFEKNYTTITIEKLKLIRRKLFDRNITFEFGLETSDEQVRENFLLKYIDNDKFIDVINLIHSYDMRVIANIIVGIPFLEEKEQIKNAVESIDWCFKNNINEVDLFPMNIRPYTLLREIYEEGKYNIISHWMLIEVLSDVPIHYLSDIYIAWYGNRDLKYSDNLHSIFPTSCDICQKDLFVFYKEYLKSQDSNVRKELINNLIANKHCKCYQKIRKK